MSNAYYQNPNERGSHPGFYDEIEPEAESELRKLGDRLGGLFQFFCESGKYDVVGRRVLVIWFNIRPDMFPEVKSEAQLAQQMGITRQAANKILREFRDTFGIRTTTMRNEENRERCRKAQVKQ